MIENTLNIMQTISIYTAFSPDQVRVEVNENEMIEPIVPSKDWLSSGTIILKYFKKNQSAKSPMRSRFLKSKTKSNVNIDLDLTKPESNISRAPTIKLT